MANPIGIAAFAFRDVIKFVLPTTLAISLFAPLLTDRLDLEHILYASILTGYIATLVVGNSFERLLISPRLKRIREGINKNNLRWDYETLTIYLDKDENDAIYLTDSYSSFYLLDSAYFLAYATLMSVLTGMHLVTLSPPIRPGLLTILWDFRMMTIVGVEMPSFVLALTGFLFARASFNAYVSQYSYLHLNTYPALAKKYHRKGIRIARGIWGRVSHNRLENPKGNQPPITVEVVDRAGKVLGDATVDKGGAFVVPNMLPRHLYEPLELRTSSGAMIPTGYLFLGDNDIPEIDLTANEASPQTDEP